ncbi:hypothetical protein JTB14_005039 [Gonioctena quinquepunctata]|nr:hypothetical protein JTB14_005039 [Gonioctena quinquepunctata]
MPEYCKICLKSTNVAKNIQEEDEYGISFLSKLQYIAPEVEWLVTYLICDDCIGNLIAGCKFREQCLKVNHGELSKSPEDLQDDFGEDNSDLLFIKEDPSDCEDAHESKDGLVKHIDTDHNNKPEIDSCKYKRREKCSQCGRKFVKNDSLQEHLLVCDGVNRHRKIGSENVHQCDKCKRYYSTDKILRAHEKKCDKGKFEKTDYQCKKCNAFFKHLCTLQKHMKNGCRRESKENPLFCEICDESFKSPLELKNHIKMDHKDCEYHKKNKHKKESSWKRRIFTCEICDSKFNFVKDIIDHYMKIHSLEEKSVKLYSCDVCNKRFRSSTNLINHKLYHERNRLNICSICGKSFITKNDLASHEMIHYNQRNYKCDKCEKAFKTSSNLRTHCIIVHSDPKLWKFICHVCGKRFPLKSNHDQHLRRHTGEKKFICSLCKKAFASKSELQEHVRYHSNVRCYRCEQCGKEYRKKNTLDIHLNKAHGIGNAKIPVRERKHACHICPGRFHDRLKLARHLCTHSGLKPFSCYICERKFTDRSYLKQHLKNAHNILEQISDSQNGLSVEN